MTKNTWVHLPNGDIYLDMNKIILVWVLKDRYELDIPVKVVEVHTPDKQSYEFYGNDAIEILNYVGYEKNNKKTIRNYSKEFYALEPLIRNYLDKPGNESGGCLHLVLSDENVNIEDLLTCLDCAISENDEDGIIILKKLMQINIHERREVVK